MISGASVHFRSGLAPHDLRSALYNALALLPGVVIIDGQKSLDGRTGTAIGVRDNNYLDAVVINSDTGEYLGQYMVQNKNFAHVPRAPWSSRPPCGCPSSTRSRADRARMWVRTAPDQPHRPARDRGFRV